MAGLCCPDCQAEQVTGHGSFRWKDGTRRPRFRCQACGRTFNPDTGTPLAYLKKRARWPGLARCMAQALPVRETAAVLGVQVATAFRWRHRLLLALGCVPQPTINGIVQVSNAFVRYSEKGARWSGGPGARGKGLPGVRRFRRIADGKPSCVLLACGPAQPAAAVIIGRGRPTSEEVQRHLAPLLAAGAAVCSFGSVPFAEACQGLGVPHQDPWEGRSGGNPWDLVSDVSHLQGQLYTWLNRFHGVATRYLANYLQWLRFSIRVARLHPRVAGQRLLTEARAILPWSAAA